MSGTMVKKIIEWLKAKLNRNPQANPVQLQETAEQRQERKRAEERPAQWELIKQATPIAHKAVLFEWDDKAYGDRWDPTDGIANLQFEDLWSLADTDGNNPKHLCQFPKIGIVFHFVYWPKVGSVSERATWPICEPDSTLDPIERDLIAYSQRDLVNRPLQSLVVDEDEHRTVDVSFPQAIVYKGEGETYGMRLPGNLESRIVPFDFTRAYTRYRNGAIVFHLGLKSIVTPFVDDLNEYEVTQLVKMWEGGEGYDSLTAHQTVKFGGVDIRKFALDEINALNITPSLTEESVIIPASAHATSNTQVPDEESGNKLHLAGGTIETINIECRDYLKDYLDGVHRDEDKYITKYIKLDVEYIKANLRNGIYVSSLGPRKVLSVGNVNSGNNPLDLKVGRALAAIGTGLFDVQNLDGDEMMDSLRNFTFDTDKRVLLINKGTMLAVESEERMFDEHGHVMGCSPYLWLPHTVAIYNNYVLRAADQKFQSAKNPGIEQDYQAAEFRLRQLIQEEYIEEAFHYDLEKQLLQKCSENRGLVKQYETAKTRIQAVNGILDEMRSSRERVQSWMLELFVAVLAVVQVIAGYLQIQQIVIEKSSLQSEFGFFLIGPLILACFALWVVDRGMLYLNESGGGLKKRLKLAFESAYTSGQSHKTLLKSPLLYLVFALLLIYNIFQLLEGHRSYYHVLGVGVLSICVALMFQNYLELKRPYRMKGMTGVKYVVSCVMMAIFLCGAFFMIGEWAEMLEMNDNPVDHEQQVIANLDALHLQFREDIENINVQANIHRQGVAAVIIDTVRQDMGPIKNKLDNVKNEVNMLANGIKISGLGENAEKQLSNIFNSINGGISQIAKKLESIEGQVAAISKAQNLDPVHGTVFKDELEKVYERMGEAYKELQELNKKVAKTREVVVNLSVIPLKKDEKVTWEPKSTVPKQNQRQ
jgi:hypothetical protein